LRGSAVVLAGFESRTERDHRHVRNHPPAITLGSVVRLTHRSEEALGRGPAAIAHLYRLRGCRNKVAISVGSRPGARTHDVLACCLIVLDDLERSLVRGS
jgi:hypothetical protein